MAAYYLEVKMYKKFRGAQHKKKLLRKPNEFRIWVRSPIPQSFKNKS